MANLSDYDERDVKSSNKMVQALHFQQKWTYFVNAKKSV